MNQSNESTKYDILESARQEFLAKGFHRASLREISKVAQVTTGAIYHYFKDKQGLFDAATREATDELKSMFAAMNDIAQQNAEHGVTYDHTNSMANLAGLYELIYKHFDQFHLLIMCSHGPVGRSLLEQMVQLEEKSTISYMERIIAWNHSTYEIDKIAMHFLIEAYVSALLEPIRHRMPLAEAIEHGQNLSEYFAIGWLGIEEKIKTK